MMSQYGSGWKPSENKGLLEQLLQKSASVNGFFLPQHSRLYKQHLRTLAALWKQGDLQASIDPSKFRYELDSYALRISSRIWHPQKYAELLQYCGYITLLN